MLTTLFAAFVLAAPQAAPAAAPPKPAEPPAKAAGEAESPQLTVGSKAPVPDISNFVRGEKPNFFEPGKTYVIEFWATWCGPCRQSMPHLSKISDEMKDKGVVVVGISDEKLETVSKFLDKDEWKQKARYTLATDPDRSTHKAYMEAAMQNGIPTAFVVKDGVVQWIGHPMELEGPLKQVVAGTWDTTAAKTTFEAAMAEQVQTMAKQAAMGKAIDAKDWPKALAMMDEQIAAAPAEERSPLQVQKMQIMLMAGQNDGAYALGDEAVKANPRVRGWVAGGILHMADIKDRRIDTAIGYLEAALAADGAVQPQVLGDLGYAWSLKGDYAKAVEFTQRAADAAKSFGPNAADYVKDLESQVKEYSAKAAGAKDPGTKDPGTKGAAPAGKDAK